MLSAFAILVLPRNMIVFGNLVIALDNQIPVFLLLIDVNHPHFPVRRVFRVLDFDSCSENAVFPWKIEKKLVLCEKT